MSVGALLADLAAAGVTLYLEAGNLRFRAPKGAMTRHRLEQVKAWRPQIVAFLAAEKEPARRGTPDLSPDASGHLEPFLERIKAEQAGRYVEGLPWPAGGRLVQDPVGHFGRYRDRFPAGLVGELAALAVGWAAGDRSAAEGWPVAPEAYRWEYSRLVAWTMAAPTELSIQTAKWSQGISNHPNPLSVP